MGCSMDVNRAVGDHAVDLLLFKNCCSSNLETAYELSDSAEVMIASQEQLPARGWPYAGSLCGRSPAADAATLAKRTNRAEGSCKQLATALRGHASSARRADFPVAARGRASVCGHR